MSSRGNNRAPAMRKEFAQYKLSNAPLAKTRARQGLCGATPSPETMYAFLAQFAIRRLPIMRGMCSESCLRQTSVFMVSSGARRGRVTMYVSTVRLEIKLGLTIKRQLQGAKLVVERLLTEVFEEDAATLLLAIMS